MNRDLSPPKTMHRKAEGSRHVLAAAGYSLDGFRRMLRETAFRHEIFAALATLCVFALIGARPSDYLVQCLLLLVLFAVEALNTAIELIVDRVSPEISVFAKQAKDLGSFAVFCLLAANCAFAVFVLVQAL